MAKKIKTKITKQQILLMERAVSREKAIAEGNANFKHKVHKTVKTYNRKRDKMVILLNF